MLMQLQIENVAVIEQANIEFSDGFQILTGETGAGKSIIIDAINAVTGEKTSKDIIRSGASKAKISVVFCEIGNEAEESIKQNGFEISEDGMIMLSRELSLEGRSVFRLNGSIVPMMVVKQIAPLLINIHGQHDNQQLFSPSKHISFIDGFAGLENELDEYHTVYRKMCAVREQLESVETDDALKERKLELLRFQIDEIASASLVSGEEEELLTRRDIIRNAEDIAENVSYALSLLHGGDDSPGAVSMAKQAAQAIALVSEYAPDLTSLSERASSAVYELEEILSEIRVTDGRFEFDPMELNQIEERLDLIFHLKQKYGGSIEEILEKYAYLQKELNDITFSEQHIEQMQKEYQELFNTAISKATQLSKKRLAACELLCNQVKKELAFLDMPNVLFSVSHHTVQLRSDGCDQIEFLISANSGEELRPLAKIASGGELSRIMLAIKTVLLQSDATGTLIFDEIDTGVSGKTARKIGEKMKQISREKQVLCVTHLAQIASLADNHLLIEKNTIDGRTFTSVRSLSDTERVQEVARIMGGEIITSVTLKAAEELIKQ